jgi:hypothetical protein
MKKPRPVPNQTYGNPSTSLARLAIDGEATHLSNELFVDCFAVLPAIERLLQESKQNGDDDDCFEGLAEDDQEHRYCEDVDGHDERLGVVVRSQRTRTNWTDGKQFWMRRDTKQLPLKVFCCVPDTS